MVDTRVAPWLTIIGIGEDGPAGLSAASGHALAQAETVFGGPRHLALAGVGARGQAWPVPFDLAPVVALRGRRVVVLASGDPFWFGAGASLSALLDPAEWISHPVVSTFQLAANRLGWRLEETICRGLHAAPFARLRPVLHAGARILVTLRDGAAAADLAGWLSGQGFGASRLWLLEALGGPRERVRETRAGDFGLADAGGPAAMAIIAEGAPGLPCAPGLPDGLFAHDGQITRAPVRALTLAALGPRPAARLWDLGAGSGSVSVEWCLAGGCAIAVERQAARAVNIRTNAQGFGIGYRLAVVEADSLAVLPDLAPADAVFVGGGASEALFDAILARLRPGTRLVANAVTLETEALLGAMQARLGGQLLQIALAEAAALGGMRGWSPARPVVQWSVTR